MLFNRYGKVKLDIHGRSCGNLDPADFGGVFRENEVIRIPEMPRRLHQLGSGAMGTLEGL